MYGSHRYGSLAAAGRGDHSEGNELEFYIGGTGFVVDDLLVAEKNDYDKTGAKVEEYHIEARVTRISDERAATIQISRGAQYLDLNPAELEFARIGNATNVNRQGSVYITSDEANAPFLQVISGVKSFDSTLKSGFKNVNTIKVRIGNLAGITDADFGTLSGFGLFTTDGYFKGKITAPDFIVTTVTGKAASGNYIPIKVNGVTKWLAEYA